MATHRTIDEYGTERMHELIVTLQALGKESHVTYHEDAPEVITHIEYEVQHPAGVVDIEVFNASAEDEIAEIEAAETASETGRFW